MPLTSRAKPVGLFFSLLVFGFSFVASSIFDQPIGDSLRVLAPLAIVWPFSSYIGMMISRGRERLGAAAMSGVVGQAFVLLVVLLAANSKTGALPMLVAVGVGNWIAALVLVRWLEPTRRRIGPPLRAIARARRDWGFKAYLGRIMSIGTYNLDVIMLGIFASSVAVANYTLSVAIASSLGLPAVAYSASRYARMAHATHIPRRSFVNSAILSVLVIPATFAMTAVVITFVLPDSYEPMLWLSLPLSVAQSIRGMSGLINIYLVSHGRGREQMVQGAAMAGTNIVLNFALIPPFGAQGAAWASAAALLVNLLVYVFLYKRTLGQEAEIRSGFDRFDAQPAGDDELPVRSSAIAPKSPDGPRKRGRVTSSLIRIGPHPLTAAAMILNRVEKRRRHARLRADYAGVVVPRSAFVSIRDLPIRLPDGDSPSDIADASTGRLRAVAEEAMAHRTDLLAAGGAPLGNPIKWHEDPKTGDAWDPERFYLDVVVTRKEDGSDAKMPWEISRSHQILALARAARLFEEPRYAAEVESQLIGWIEANPPGQGINWVNAMEISIRSINWVWALGTLPANMKLSKDNEQRVAESLRFHAGHIASNLEGSPLVRGNHYLAYRVGQFVLAWALRGDPLSPVWERDSRKALEREIVKQVHEDGLNFEASTAYHGLALELFLLAWIVGEWSGQPFSDGYRKRLEAMVGASLAITRPDGLIPLFGDNDSARLLPFDEDRTPTHNQLLWVASGVLGTPAPALGDPDPEVAWTAGMSAWERACSTERDKPAPSSAFPEGGIWTLSNGPGWAAIRCGDVGQGGTGGHAHNDALSFEYSVGSEPVVVDPGTFVYTADPDARNLFRSTRVHSTVSVDGQEINPIAPAQLFQLRQVAWPRCTEYSPGGDEATWSGFHDGWLRLEQEAIHTRTLRIKADGSLHVTDRIDGTGRALIEASLPLAPGIAVSQTDGLIRLEGRTPLILSPPDKGEEVSLEVVDIAERYGSKMQSTLVRFRFDT
ncbi:MAG: heparinase II/III family protein, partial [Actinomycetes bacterium]